MSKHRATIEWERGPAEFRYASYSRDHTWTFEGGIRVDASAAPGYLGNADFVDPEEAYVAALASCHMLTFLAIAAREGIVVDRYRDAAVGFMGRNDEGGMAVTRVVLRPELSFRPPVPSRETLDRMHRAAHRQCFIANSVRTTIAVEAGMISPEEGEGGRAVGTAGAAGAA
ncbi:MAG: OsmC family protein [Gammaproteobacteria bacterium]|nr:OsmC family protein [Gammaproteobacteria bacterium]MDE0249105.1 OsmC family protein [Gammaproteobacteria bacterium]